MAESEQPKINIINIASDDAMWVLETDHSELLQVLADPAEWVRTNVEINGEAGVLWEPFVVIFHEVSPSGEKPTIHVQGIHETAVLTVKYSRSSAPPPDITGLLPEGEVLGVLKVGQRLHTHLEMKGFTKSQVANTLFMAVTHPKVYIAALNELPQTLNGADTQSDQKIKFDHDPTKPPHVTFQGWTPKVAITAASTPSQETASGACNVGAADANAEGQVIVNGIIVKTYIPQPKG